MLDEHIRALVPLRHRLLPWYRRFRRFRYEGGEYILTLEWRLRNGCRLVAFAALYNETDVDVGIMVAHSPTSWIRTIRINEKWQFGHYWKQLNEQAAHHWRNL